MATTEFQAPAAMSFDSAETMLATTFTSAGLDVTMYGTLRQYRGSVHWHLKRGRQSGTLEATLIPSMPLRLLIEVRSNRAGAWTDAAVVALTNAFTGFGFVIAGDALEVPPTEV